MPKPAKTANIAGGMFAEFEPAPPVAKPKTATLFDVPGADDTDTGTGKPDYGKPEAPVRTVATGGLFETEFVVRNGMLDAVQAEDETSLAEPTSPAEASRMLGQIIGHVGYHLRSSHALDDNHLRTMVHVTSRESADQVRAVALASDLVDRVTAYNPASGFVVVHWTHHQA